MSAKFKHADKVDMRFKYVAAAATDIRKSIKRELNRRDELAEKQRAAEAEVAVKVRRMK